MPSLCEPPYCRCGDPTRLSQRSGASQLVLRYAEEMTFKIQAGGALVEALKRQLSPETLVQTTQIVAVANFTNRLADAIGTERGVPS